MNYLEIVSQLRIEEGYWNLKICVFILFFFTLDICLWLSLWQAITILG